MRVTVEQIDREREEELIVRCHDPGAAWVQGVQEAVSGQQTVCGWREDEMHRLKLSEVFYFEVVDERAFVYTQADVFEAKERGSALRRAQGPRSFLLRLRAPL